MSGYLFFPDISVSVTGEDSLTMAPMASNQPVTGLSSINRRAQGRPRESAGRPCRFRRENAR